MKIKAVSDLHTEFWNFNKFERILNMIIPPQEDDKKTVICLAGDCGLYNNYNSTYKPLFKYLGERFRYVLCVPGNHSWYHSAVWGKEDAYWKDKKLPKNVFYMDDDFRIIDDVVFIGATLWTDFNKSDPMALYHASKGMNDFVCIKKRDYEICATYGQVINSNKLSPEDTVIRHDKSVEYLKIMLDLYKDKKCVVITHHAPTSLGILDRYRGDLLNCAFHNNMEEFILDRPQIKYWIHGHMHNCCIHSLGETQLIRNTYGYKDQEVCKEFNPNLVLEI